jgi:hypothetical protein
MALHSYSLFIVIFYNYLYLVILMHFLNIVLRLHVQINFTYFMYFYSVSFDVKEEISVLTIYSVSVLNFRVQWPDEVSIVEP